MIWGNTYDDGGPPTEVQKIDLAAWIDECVETMVNPDRDDLTALLEREHKKAKAPDIATMLDDYMAGRTSALHDMSEYQSVTSRADVDVLVNAILEGIKRKDTHLAGTSSDLLEGTRVERDYAVQQLTATLAHAIDKGAMDTAESISFNIGEMLADADAATIATLEKLAAQLDNDYLAEALEEARG